MLNFLLKQRFALLIVMTAVLGGCLASEADLVESDEEFLSDIPCSTQDDLQECYQACIDALGIQVGSHNPQLHLCIDNCDAHPECVSEEVQVRVDPRVADGPVMGAGIERF